MSALKSRQHPMPEPAAVTDSESLLQAAMAEPDPARSARLREQAVLQNRGLAIGLARRFDHRGVDREDLQQVAMVGLVLAARRYRPGKGNGFTAFAAPTISGEIKRYFRDHGWAVRPPRALQEAQQGIRAARDTLAQDLGREPRAAELASAAGYSVRTVRGAQQVESQYRSVSLDHPVGGEESALLRDTLGDLDPSYAQVEAVALLEPALAELTEREQLIVRLRFTDNLTQREIGQRLGVSQMQVSRLLGGILGRLAERLTAPESGAEAA